MRGVRTGRLVPFLGWWLAAIPLGRCETISLCGDIWCPYNCKPASSSPGTAVEIAQAVFGAAGYKIDYEEVNWARCVEDARSGLFSGIIGAITRDAPDFTFPTSPIGISGDAYAVRQGDNFQFTGPESLRGRVLGVIRNYTFNGPIGAYIAANTNDPSRIEYVSGDGALVKNLAKLVAGRVDVVVDDKYVLLNSIAELGLKDRVRVLAGLNTTPIYIAFSPRSGHPAHLAQLLDAGIIRLRASGQLAAILNRYHVQDMH